MKTTFTYTRYGSRYFFMLLAFFCVPLSALWAQSVDADHFRVDTRLKLIVCNQMPATTGTTIQLDKSYKFSENVGSAFQVGKAYTVTNDNVTYTLFFTDLPLIHVKTNNKATISMNDDVLTRGNIFIAESNGQPFTSNMGVRVRGNLSKGYPKKSYKVELSNDAAGNDARDATLLGMREDSEWLLMAMYKEPLRSNNKSGWALWQRMHKLPYAAKEPEGRSYIRMKYVDVFVNDDYKGIYAFTEQIDRKQLKLKKQADNGDVKGELYKGDNWSGATRFDGLPALPPNTGLIWASYEIKLPKQPFWNNLYNLVEFVHKAQVDEFKNEIGQRMDLNSLMDYFIFLNVIRGTDNSGKNTYLARYKENDPYFIVPWDLDGTYGYLWDGSKTNRHIDIMTNGLFTRLLSVASYQRNLKKRWFALRQNELSIANIKNDLAVNSTFLTEQGGFQREKMVWPATLATQELEYINSWLDKRVAYLDQYFSTLLDENSPVTTVGNFEGFLGNVDCNNIIGWVWDINQPRAAITYELMDGDTPVTSGLANIYREDLSTRGNGMHGFNFPFPESLKDNKQHTLSVRVQGSTYLVKQSARKITCAGTAIPANQAPVPPASLPTLSATLNTVYSQTLPPFTDPENKPLTYALTGLPAGLNFNATNLQISGTPQTTGTYSLTYTATDQPGLNRSVTLSLTVANTPPANQAPVQPASLPTLSATVNTVYSQTLPPFTDPENTSLTHALIGLPTGLNFNAANLQISGTPQTTGTYSLTYSATDQPGLNKTVTLVLTVANTPPTTVNGNFDGYLDKVECGTIRGWVWDRDKGNLAVTIEIYTQNPAQSWGTTVANIFRQDLKDAGKGNGAHAYSFTVPAELKDNTERTIYGRVLGSTFVLKGSPKTLKCPPANARLSAESQEKLQVTLLGNPAIGREITAEVRGAHGQPLRFQLTDVLGRVVAEHAVKEAGTVEQHSLPVGSSSSGVLFLRVTSGQRSVTLKALRQ